MTDIYLAEIYRDNAIIRRRIIKLSLNLAETLCKEGRVKEGLIIMK